MKMKIAMLKKSDKMELQDGRILPIGTITKPPSGATMIYPDVDSVFDGTPINMVEVVKCWKDDILLYQRVDFDKETAYCEHCDTVDEKCFRPDHYEMGVYSTYGEWECGKCHTTEGFGVLRQCSACGGEFNSKEGEYICEICQERIWI